MHPKDFADGMSSLFNSVLSPLRILIHAPDDGLKQIGGLLPRDFRGSEEFLGVTEVVDEEKLGEFHKLAKGFDARVAERHELLHKGVVKSPLLDPVPELAFRNVVNEVVLVQPVEFLEIKVRSRNAYAFRVKLLDHLV